VRWFLMSLKHSRRGGEEGILYFDPWKIDVSFARLESSEAADSLGLALYVY